MKLYRSALMAGLLALGVAACGDDVEVVSPAPPVAPPPPPVTATMAPASASVAVGNSVVFAVNASGGVAGEAASWTCSSSNTGIATVSSTSAGCQATGVVAGSVTVTASVSKSGETVNVGAQLTVTSDEVVGTAGDPAFVLVRSVTADTDDGSLSGTLSVEVGVERGDQTLEQLSLLVDGEVVAYQSFGSTMGMAPPEDEAAEQAVHSFNFSFDSGDYGDDGTPSYMNGEHTISADLQIAGGMMADGMMGHETVSSNTVTVEFDNDDGVHVTADFPGNSAMNPETGELWYGGPNAGDFTITVAPVMYSGGGAVESVTLRGVCGADAVTDAEAPYEFTLECEESGPVTPVFSIATGGNAITDLSPKNESIFPLNLDYVGPPAPYFSPNPNDREGGWVNLTVDFLGKQGSSNKDGWLVYNEDDSGVGGYIPQLRISTAVPEIVGGALAAGPVEGVPALPPGGTKKDAVCAVVTAKDLLGNESKLPKADAPCAIAAGYEDAIAVLDAAEDEEDEDAIAEAKKAIPAGIRGGLDILAPTIEFSASSPKENASSLKEFQVQIADAGGSTGKSGLHSEPVLAKIEVRDADNDILCGDDDDVGGMIGKEDVAGVCKLAPLGGFNNPLATTAGLSGSETVGYYTFTAEAQDKAGNKSEQLVRTAVNDGEAPELGLIVGGYDKGAFSLTATLTDDLSVKQYWAEAFDAITDVGNGSVLILPREDSVAVDDYNSADLTQSLLTSPPVTMMVFRALQAGEPSTAPAAIDSIRVVATDQSGKYGSASNEEPAGNDAFIEGLDRFGFQTALDNLDAGEEEGDFDDEDLLYSRDEVFQDFNLADDESDDDTLELRAEIVGTAGYTEAEAEILDDDDTPDVDEAEAAVPGVEGLVDNPVSRVDFYAAVALEPDGADEQDDPNDVPPEVVGPGTEALVFIGSSSAAGAEDFDATPDDEGGESRRYVWALDMSGAAFLEALGEDANEAPDTDGYTIVAFAVNSDGVAISAVAANVGVEK